MKNPTAKRGSFFYSPPKALLYTDGHPVQRSAYIAVTAFVIMVPLQADQIVHLGSATSWNSMVVEKAISGRLAELTAAARRLKYVRPCRCPAHNSRLLP